ncbi:MAG: 6-phosphogluconolactonase, partial [Planctomycetota bacterium]
RETIVDHADIPIDQVHPMTTAADGADERYEQQLRDALGWREKGHDRLDYVLLALAADGSVGGLLPHSSTLCDDGRLVRLGDAASAPHGITMTAALINAARFIAVVACGSAQADAVGRLVAGGEPRQALPVAGIAPLKGQLKWYLDAEACGVEG